MEVSIQGNGLEDQGLAAAGAEEDSGHEAELERPQGQLNNLNPSDLNPTGITSELGSQHVCVNGEITNCTISSIEAHTSSKNEGNSTIHMHLNYHASNLEEHTSLKANELNVGTSGEKQNEAPPTKELQREDASEARSFEACKDHVANLSIIVMEEQTHMLDGSTSGAKHLKFEETGKDVSNGKKEDVMLKCTENEDGINFRPGSSFSSFSQESRKDSHLVPVPSLVSEDGEDSLVIEDENLRIVNDVTVKNSSTGNVQEPMAEAQTSVVGPTKSGKMSALVADVDQVEDDQHGLMKRFSEEALDGLNRIECSVIDCKSSLSSLPFSSEKSIPMNKEQLVCNDVDQDSNMISASLKKRERDEEQGSSSKKTNMAHVANIVHVSEHIDIPAEDISETLTQPVLNYEKPSSETRSILESAKVLTGDSAPQRQFLELSHAVPVSEFGVDLMEMQGSAEVWTEQLQFADSCLSFSDSIIAEHNFVDEPDRLSVQGKILQILSNSMPSELPLKLVNVEENSLEPFGNLPPPGVPLELGTVSERKCSEAFSDPLPPEDVRNAVAMIAAVAERAVHGIRASKPKEPTLSGVENCPDNEEPFLQAVVSSEMDSETLNVSQENDLGNNISESVRVNALPFDGIEKDTNSVASIPVCSVTIHVTTDGDATLDPLISYSVGNTNTCDPESPLKGHASTNVETETPSLQGLQGKGMCDSNIKEFENAVSAVAGIPDSKDLQGEGSSFEAEAATAETETPSLQHHQDLCDSGIKEHDNTSSTAAGIPDSEHLQGEKTLFKADVAEDQNTSNNDASATQFESLENTSLAGNASEIAEAKGCHSHLIQLDAKAEKPLEIERGDKMMMTHMTKNEYSEADALGGVSEVCARGDATEKTPTVTEYLDADKPSASQTLPVTPSELRDANESSVLIMQGVPVPSSSNDRRVLPPASEKVVLPPLAGDSSVFSEISKYSSKELTAATDVPQSLAPVPMEVDLSPHVSDSKTTMPPLVILDHNTRGVPFIASRPAFSEGSKDLEKESTAATDAPQNLTSTSMDVSAHGLELKTSRPPLVFPDHNIRDARIEMFLGHRPVTDAQQVQLRSQILIYGSLLQGLLPEESYMSLAFMDTRAATHEIGKVQNRGMWERTWQIAAKSQLKFANATINNGENHKRAVISSTPARPSGLLHAASKASVSTTSLSSVSPSILPSAVRPSVFDVRFTSNAGLRSFPISSGADIPSISNMGIRSSLAAPLQTPNNILSAAVPPGMLHSDSIRGLVGFQAPFAESWQWGVGSYLLQSQALPFSVPLSSAAWWTPSSYPRPPILGSEVRSAASTLGSADQAPQRATTNMGSSLQLLSPYVKSASGSSTSTSNADPGNTGKGARARRTRLLEARSRKRMKSDSLELSVVSEGVGAADRFKENSVLHRGQCKESGDPPETEAVRVVESVVSSSLEVREEAAFKSPVCSGNSARITEAVDISAERSSSEYAVPLDSVQINKGEISEGASTLIANSAEPSSFSKGVECTGVVNRSFSLEERSGNGQSMPMESTLAVGKSSQMQASSDAAAETPAPLLPTLGSGPDTSKETILTFKDTNITLPNDGDGGTASACRSGKSVSEAGNLEKARMLAENIELDASSSLQISQSFWNELYSQKNADRGFDKNSEVAFLAVTITSAVLAVKAAAAAGKVAYEAALQAKGIASELFSVGASEDPENLKPEVKACNDVTKKAPADRVEAALSSSKKAQMLDGVVQAIDLAVKAASHAGAIITMGDPIPFNLRSLQENGLDTFLKRRSIIDERRPEVDLSKGVHSQQEMGLSLTETQPTEVDGLLPPKEVEAAASFGKEEHEQPSQKDMAKRGQNEAGSHKKRTDVAPNEKEENSSLPTNSMTATTRSEAITAVAELILEAEEEKLRQTRESIHMEQERLRRITEDIKEDVVVEVIQEEDGIREGWFKARVLKVDNAKVLVVYDDLYDEEEDCQLEEWVPLPTSMHDPPRVRLLKDEGTRKRRRSTIGNQVWLIGDHVDALINDGWWEGIVKSVNEEDEKLVTVMFPDGQTSVMKSWNLRPALTWRDGCWVPWTVSVQDNQEQDAIDTPLKRQKSEKGYAVALMKDNLKLSPETKPRVAETRANKGKQLQEVLDMKRKSLQESTSHENNQKAMPQNHHNAVSQNASNAKSTALEISKATFGVPKPTKKRKFMADIEKAQPMDMKGFKGSSKDEKEAKGGRVLLSSSDKEKREQALPEDGAQPDEKDNALQMKSKYKNPKADDVRPSLPRIRGVPTIVSMHGSSTQPSNMVVKKKHGILRNPFSRGVGLSKRMEGKSLPNHFRKQLENLEKLQKTSEKGAKGLKTDDYRRSSRTSQPSFKLLQGFQSASKAAKKDELPH